MVNQIQYKPKHKACKQCGKEYMPYNPLQVVCSPVCALEYNSKKEVDKRVKKLKKGLKTYSDYINALQVVFNAYIRRRDANKGCISCGVELTGKYDAGHYFSCGAYPNLRFNEDNVHGQCVLCNQHLHGNSIEYGLRLEKRIGLEKFNKLMELRKETTKLSIPEIQILIKKYKTKKP